MKDEATEEYSISTGAPGVCCKHGDVLFMQSTVHRHVFE